MAKRKPAAPRNKGGRPPFEPTYEQRKTVEAMVGYGIPQDSICQIITKSDGTPISKPTLEKHFRAEIDQGAVKANAKIAESLFKQAVGGNVTAGIWWTKARMGWKEPPARQVNYNKSIDDMSEEELLETLGGEPEPEELGTAAGNPPSGHA